MNWIKLMQSVLNFIENNLNSDLNPVIITKEAFTISFHFQRMFSIITGISLTEYIRKRRLTAAAQELFSIKFKL